MLGGNVWSVHFWLLIAVPWCHWILCDGQHEHAPRYINNGVFDTSLEAEYTPCLAKALTTAVNTSSHILRNMQRNSGFHIFLPSQLPNNSPERFSFPLFLSFCLLLSFPICHVMLLSTFPIQFYYSAWALHGVSSPALFPVRVEYCERPTEKGVRSVALSFEIRRGEIRRFKLSVEHTQTLRSLPDTGQGQNSSSDAELRLRKCVKVGDSCIPFFSRFGCREHNWGLLWLGLWY